MLLYAFTHVNAYVGLNTFMYHMLDGESPLAQGAVILLAIVFYVCNWVRWHKVFKVVAACVLVTLFVAGSHVITWHLWEPSWYPRDNFFLLLRLRYS